MMYYINDCWHTIICHGFSSSKQYLSDYNTIEKYMIEKLTNLGYTFKMRVKISDNCFRTDFISSLTSFFTPNRWRIYHSENKCTSIIANLPQESPVILAYKCPAHGKECFWGLSASWFQVPITCLLNFSKSLIDSAHSFVLSLIREYSGTAEIEK